VTKREKTRATRAMAMAIKGTGDKEGGDSTAIEIATRMAGEWTAMAMKRAMGTATRVAGKQQ
jgi:hypothetical protein